MREKQGSRRGHSGHKGPKVLMWDLAVRDGTEDRARKVEQERGIGQTQGMWGGRASGYL